MPFFIHFYDILGDAEIPDDQWNNLLTYIENKLCSVDFPVTRFASVVFLDVNIRNVNHIHLEVPFSAKLSTCLVSA